MAMQRYEKAMLTPLMFMVALGTALPAVAQTTPLIELALTFDDLPGGLAEIHQVLEALKAEGLTNTFGFVNGGQLEGHKAGRQGLQAWVGAGQRLGNHTYSHADLQRLGTARYMADFDRNEAILRSFDTTHDWRVFRYPFLYEGDTPEQYRLIRDEIQRRHYRVAQVTVDPYDWAYDDAFNRCTRAGNHDALGRIHDTFMADMLRQLAWAQDAALKLAGRPIKHILLLHVRSMTAAYVAELLPALKQAGVQFIDLEEALKDDIYQLDFGDIAPVGGTFLRQFLSARPAPGATRAPRHPTDWLDGLCR